MSRIVTRVQRTVACVGVLLCLGCAEERPTRPVGQISLRAMNLSDSPVLQASDSVAAIAVNDTDFVIPLAGLPLVKQGREDEIQITFNYGVDWPRRDPSVYDYSADTWRALEGVEAGTSGGCVDCPWFGFRLLSQVGPGFQRSLISGTSNLSLLIPNGRRARVSARAFSFHPEYQFITINSQRVDALDCLAGDGTSMWYVKWLYSDGPPEGDSLIEFDHQGNRVNGFWLPNYIILSMAFGDGELWVLRRSGVATVSRIGADGILTTTLEIVLSSGWRPISLAWVRESLWLLSERDDSPYVDVDSLFEVDMPASVAIGSAQFRRRFEIPRRLEYLAIAGRNDQIMAWSTYTFGHAPSALQRYDLSGSLIDSLALPVFPASGMAWDGEALWMLHHGPPEAYTDATLLSRFYIR